MDVFSQSHEYLGEVVLPVVLKSPGAGFHVAGEYLATVTVDEASAAEFVTLWRVAWID